MLTLQPIRFPRPVPIPRWTDDYSDIPERIRVMGRLDVAEDIWPPDSDDGLKTFYRQHRTAFDLTWEEMVERQRWRPSRKFAERVRQQQEEWEEAARKRQLAKQAQADREWQAAEQAKQAQEERKRQEIDKARTQWTVRNRAYADQPYRAIPITTGGVIDGLRLEAGNTYWLPHGVLEQIKGTPERHAKAERDRQKAEALLAAECASVARRPSIAQVEIDEARAWWVLRNPSYARQPFFQIVALKNGVIDGFQFWAGNCYVVPATIMQMLR